MSRDFRPTRPIPGADLFGGRLEKYGVHEKIVEGQSGTTETRRCLTDGTNYLWVEISERGFVAMITRYGVNDCNFILNAIVREFDTDIIDEEHPEFWEGFEGEVIGIPSPCPGSVEDSPEWIRKLDNMLEELLPSTHAAPGPTGKIDATPPAEPSNASHRVRPAALEGD